MKRNYYKNMISPGAHASPPFQQKILDKWLKWISEKGKIRTMLDIGSGLGFNLPILSQFSSQAWASDISPTALKENQKAHSNLKNVKYVACEAQALKFPDDHFDLVVCTEVLEHIKNQEAVVNECCRVLKPKGSLILSTPNYNNLIGMVKWYKDKKAGREYWEPWGAHREGFEKKMTPDILHELLSGSFRLLKTQGANFFLAWLFFLPRHPGINYDQLSFPFLGKLPFIKRLGMHYYILAQKK